MVADDKFSPAPDTDQTLSPTAGEKGSPKDLQPQDDSDRLYQLSLTPINVLERIHADIVAFLGINKGINGEYSSLEKKLVSGFEKIVRKGECPSLLVEDKATFRALLCLQSYYEDEKVTILQEEPGGTYKNVTYNVFPTLYKTATEATKLADQIKELRTKLGATVEQNKRNAIRKKIDKKREQKEQCSLLYQKIVFTHAANIQKASPKPRKIMLHGQQAGLNELLEFFQQSGPAVLSKMKAALNRGNA